MTEAVQAQLVRTELVDGTLTVTLDSPHNANALSTTLLSQLDQALASAAADAAVRVVVLTGAGKVFCSGADLKEAKTSPSSGGSGPSGARGHPPASGVSPRASTAAAPIMGRVVQGLWDSPKPVIARVNGAARAGGLGLIAACDIAIAAEHASFAFSEVRIGVVPAVISVPCLRRMPSRAAAEYFLTGEIFHANRAVEIGLLTRSVAVEDLDAEVNRYTDMLRRGAPNALAATKGVLRNGITGSFADGLAAMSDLSARHFASDEAGEGMAAFAAKRDPAWVISPGAES
ncbi:MAG TPA: enoyl-CoA hydratase-related protein [Streptosporangiaceae bacterium]|nr:enoyl-CoA hydratase-related protein [Streptosporangiaceae bacterium]